MDDRTRYIYIGHTEDKYPYIIVRHEMGHLTGYVGVPKGHRAYGLDYHKLEDVHVHGGVTYSGPGSVLINDGLQLDEDTSSILDNNGRKLWFFGFDCAHAGDLVPFLDGLFPDSNVQYRNFSFVSLEVEALSGYLWEYNSRMTLIQRFKNWVRQLLNLKG